jgi:hypothetical protein
VRIWFSNSGIEIKEDVKTKGLGDVVLDAIVVQELGAWRQAQDDHGNAQDAILVDLAVVEGGISRVLEKSGILKFYHLSSDDSIILKQPTKDLESKKALCFYRLHSRYPYKYGRRQNLAERWGSKVPLCLKTWYEDTLQVIGRRLEKLGNFSPLHDQKGYSPNWASKKANFECAV